MQIDEKLQDIKQDRSSHTLSVGLVNILNTSVTIARLHEYNLYKVFHTNNKSPDFKAVIQKTHGQ